MKKLNKKGFTIVELVIVIAVIAILSAVLIPTFSSVIKKANKSNADQAARNAVSAVLTEFDEATIPAEAVFIYTEGDGKTYYEYQMLDGVFTEKKGQTTTIDNNDIIYGKATFNADTLKDALKEADGTTFVTDNYTQIEDLSKNVYVVVPVANLIIVNN